MFAVKKGTQAPTTAPTTPTADINATNPPLGGPLTTPGGPLDLQQFFAAWGTPNAKFDLSKDGTVDAKDLALYLGNASGKSVPKPQVTAQDVLNSWGQTSGAGDINGDGTVDAVDLGLALGDAKPANNQDAAVGVQKSWGTSNPTYDLNKDGTVDGTDLGLALGGGSQPSPASPESVADKLVSALFTTHDADQDDQLSVEELPASSAKLAGKADTDRDGVIGREELRAQLTQELTQVQTRRPDADLSRIADRWMNAFLGRADPQAIAARGAYGRQFATNATPAVNARA